MASEFAAEVARIRPKGTWPLLVAVPPESLSTEKARGVLPKQYSRADAVTNIQNSMLLLAAFVQQRPELLRNALRDRMHQPYRAALCPLLPALEELDVSSGVLGVALSGAGPSVLIFLDPKASSRKAARAIGAHLQKANLDAELLLTEIALEGAMEGWHRRER
jgi:homoserine kinase